MIFLPLFFKYAASSLLSYRERERERERERKKEREREREREEIQLNREIIIKIQIDTYRMV